MVCQKNEYRLCIYILSMSLTTVFTGIYLLLHSKYKEPKLEPVPMPVPVSVPVTTVLEVGVPQLRYRHLLL